MAKHDQRILKFLNQNVDRPPTITEMMTRLNISISDISDSLASLQAQGLIAKKVNNQGIEVWFPGGAPQAAPAMAMVPPQVPERLPPQRGPLAQPTAQIPAMGGPIAVDARAGSEVRSPFHGDRSMPAPEPQPPSPRPVSLSEREARPVQVQHMSDAPAPAPRGLESGSLSNLPQPPVFNGASPMYGLAPAPRGVGFLTLLAGLAVAVGASYFLATRLIAKEVRKASATFVDRKALVDANAALTDFQEKTKAHVTALEAQVRKLSDDLAASRSATDSLKVAAAAAATGKEPAAAKAGKNAKAADEPKSAKSKKAVAAKAKPSASTALAKAAARGAALRKKSSKPARESSGDELSSGPSEESSSRSAENPGVPNPPGLDELPPPPAEE